MFVPSNPPLSLSGHEDPGARALADFPDKVRIIYPSARVALMAAFKRRPQNRAIWLPAFMCRSVLTPMEACRLQLRYYDLDRRLGPDLATVTPSRGDYLMAVHFFGIYQSLTGIKSLCQEWGLVLVEDCAHILPDPKASCPAGAVGDIAIFSLRKLLPVSQGGVLLDRTAAELPGEQTAAGRPAPLRFKKRVLMVAENLAFQTGLNLLPVKLALRRFIGNTDSPTLSGERQSGWGSLDLPARADGAGYLAAVVGRRRKNYGYLAEHLRQLPEVDLPFPQLPPGSCPQAFPLLVSDRERISAQLHRRGIEAVIWPGEEGVSLSGDAYPGTRHWQERLLLLPVHQELREVHLDYIVRSLRQDLTDRS